MRNYFWGFFLIAIGTLLLLDHLDIVQFDEVIRDYWPLILIFWGLSILFGRRRLAPEILAKESSSVGYDLLHQSSVFGDLHVGIISQNFKGGSVSTVFGNGVIDLSKAAFDMGEHILRVHSVFGDTTVILPKDAAVSVSGSSVAGRLDILGQRKEGISSNMQTATPNYDSAQNRLKIAITKVFGSVHVS